MDKTNQSLNQKQPTYWILGFGASGEAAARLLRREGSDVFVFDEHTGPELERRAIELEELGARIELGVTELPTESPAHVVVSPGMAKNHAWLTELAARGAHMVSELELGWRRASCPIIAVTGSNGKSTVVKLIAHCLQTCGVNALPAGNYGMPLSQAVGEAADQLIVEVSSFQLEWIESFQPDMGILLNVQPNHLNRHGTLEVYAECKAGLFRNLAADAPHIVHESNLDWLQDRYPDRTGWISFGETDGADWRFHEGAIRHEGRRVADWGDAPHQPALLGPAAAAALAAVVSAGIPADAATPALASFTPLPHRLEFLGAAGGISFINDSKSTSLSALAAAVSSCQAPIRLIAGGQVKEPERVLPLEQLRRKVACAYLIGRDAASLAEDWGPVVSCLNCGSMEAAFEAATADARPGETVLLSPGAASFDQYSGFAKRGLAFESLARKFLLQNRTASNGGFRGNAMDNPRESSRIAARNSEL
jgi:UDP-N-acetylmuramoylalanine--D-glutamate ligase